MSEIATLEKLEPFLAQVNANPAPSQPAAALVVPEPRQVLANGSAASHLELFFSEVSYSTFVSKKKPAPRLREARPSSNSSEGALKYRLRLH